jgi:hypothetical protein
VVGKTKPPSEVRRSEGFGYAGSRMKQTFRGLIQEKPQQDDDRDRNPEQPQKYSA